MDESKECDVYHSFTSDGCKFLITTHQIVFQRSGFGKKETSVSLIDIMDVARQVSPFSNLLVITTVRDQRFKFKFKTRKMLCVLEELVKFQWQQTKDSLKAGLLTMRQLDLDFDSLIFHEQVGEGAYGRVYRGEWNGLSVAIKRVNTDTIHEQQSFTREISCLVSLRHPSCIQFYGLAYPHDVNSGSAYIVLEYCKYGSLYDSILEQKDYLYYWEYLLRIFYDICRGMQYVHSKGLVHRDLKPENVMVCLKHFPMDADESSVKIVDFGISRFLVSKSDAPRTLCGTPGNFAPEIFTQEYSFPCDVFSFGILMYKTIFKAEAFPNIRFVSDYKRAIDEKQKPKILFPLPPLVQEILFQCLNYSPDCRPTFQELTQFFRNCVLHFRQGNSFPDIPGKKEDKDVEEVAQNLLDVLTPVGSLTRPDYPSPQIRKGTKMSLHHPLKYPSTNDGI